MREGWSMLKPERAPCSVGLHILQVWSPKLCISASIVLTRGVLQLEKGRQVPDLLINRPDSSASFLIFNDRFKVPLVVLTRRSLVCLFSFTPLMQKSSRLKEERLHQTELCVSCALATIPRLTSLTFELGILMAFECVGHIWHEDLACFGSTHVDAHCDAWPGHTCRDALTSVARHSCNASTCLVVLWRSCFVSGLLEQLMSREFWKWMRLLWLHVRLLCVIRLAVQCFSYHLGDWVLLYLFRNSGWCPKRLCGPHRVFRWFLKYLKILPWSSAYVHYINGQNRSLALGAAVPTHCRDPPVDCGCADLRSIRFYQCPCQESWKRSHVISCHLRTLRQVQRFRLWFASRSGEPPVLSDCGRKPKSWPVVVTTCDHNSRSFIVVQICPNANGTRRHLTENG